MGDENEGLVGQVREGQEKLRLSTNQVNNLIREIEEFKNRIIQFSNENQDLKRKLQEAGDINRKFNESENTLTSLSKEI